MLHAMTSGHDGSLTTLHASGPRMALSRLEVLAMSADSNLVPQVVRQMVGSGVDLVAHLSNYQRGDAQVRRLGSLSFVAENPEDPLGAPSVLDLCNYRVESDSWEWRPESLKYMPDKIRLKFQASGIDPGQLARDMIEDGWA